jgi:hypothetical protein
MPIKNSNTPRPDANQLRQAAFEIVEALKRTTPTSLFTHAISTIHLVERAGQALLRHGNAAIVLHHYQDEAIAASPSLLVTRLMAPENETEPVLADEQWRAICVIQELLTLQSWIIDAPIGARELWVKTRVDKSVTSDRFFALSRVEHGIEQGKNMESNSLISLFLCEFCRTYGIRYSAIPLLGEVFFELNQKALTSN